MYYNGCFRSKQGYTAVQNGITRDRTVSLKAKGLYLLIQSYITIPDSHWHKQQFMKMVQEGRKAFDSAWNELKEKGYLHMHIYTNGKVFDHEYELLDEPDNSAHTFYYNAKGEVTKRIGNTSEESTVVTEDSRMSPKGAIGKEDSRVSQNGTFVNGTFGNGTFENGTFENGTINNNTIEINTNDNNSLSINPSANHSDGRTDAELPVVIDSFEQMDKLECEMVRHYLSVNGGVAYSISKDIDLAISVIKYLSNWDMYFNDGTELDRQAYILAVQCLSEMVTAKKTYVYNGSKVSYVNVIDQINALCKLSKDKNIGMVVSMCATHFVRALTKSDILNKKQYMKSILWTDMSSGEIDWLGYFHRSYYGTTEKS